MAAEDNKVVVRVFYDFGTGLSSEDPYWQSHFCKQHANNLYTESRFDYEHGSISRMYHSCNDDQHS